MDRYKVLDCVEKVELQKVRQLLIDFINSSIVEDKKERWIEISSRPSKLYKKINAFWNALDLNKVTKHDFLTLSEQKYIYYDLGEEVYLVNKEEAEVLYPDKDGFLFGLKTKESYFLTHESIYCKKKED